MMVVRKIDVAMQDFLLRKRMGNSNHCMCKHGCLKPGGSKALCSCNSSNYGHFCRGLVMKAKQRIAEGKLTNKDLLDDIRTIVRYHNPTSRIGDFGTNGRAALRFTREDWQRVTGNPNGALFVWKWLWPLRDKQKGDCPHCGHAL